VAQELLDHAGVARDALVLGVGGLLELWDPTRYEKAAGGRTVDRGAIDDQLYG
jgi:DNA-binding transcriptional regulator/RsmH inhibitor MraZ